jgi:tetratricopeptide (TPR) repeat protein
MNHPLFLIFLIGLLYVLLLRAVSPLRREGISNQFVIEGLGVLGLLLLVMYVGGFVMHPLYALLILYVITMRVRLVVELGNQFSKLGRPQNALAVYNFALRLFPDQPSRVIVSLNTGAAYLHCQQPERAIEVLEQVKGQIVHQLASKYMASCCYNLGMAYRRVGRRTEALKHFREVGEIYPLSRYARLAELAYNSTLNESDSRQ